VEIKYKEYEAMVIFEPNTPEETLAETCAKVEEFVAQYDGRLHRTDKWAKRYLAYPIKKFTEGIYVIFRFSAPRDIVDELVYMFRYHEKILRHIVIDYTEKSEKASRRKARTGAKTKE
jgi:small subunit ribosomal protein S6